MNRILADVTAFGRQYLRSRVGTFFALAFPVILILLFGAIFSSSGAPKVPLAVQDLDSTTASRGFVQALNNTTLITYQAIPTNVNFQDYMRAHSINVALQIPGGFQAALIRAEMGNASAKVNVTLAGDRTQSSFGIVYSAVAAVATAFNLKVANATEVVSVDESQFTVRQFGYIDFFLPGIIGFTVLTTHYLDEAEQLADDVAILNHGKIVAHGSPSALISQFGEGTTVVLAGAGRGGFEALVSRGIAAELHGVDVLVHVPMASQVRPMLAKLASIEVPLTEIYTKRSTLEDVFLKLVGARMEEGVLAA